MQLNTIMKHKQIYSNISIENRFPSRRMTKRRRRNEKKKITDLADQEKIDEE